MGDARLDPRKRKAYGTGPALAIVGVRGAHGGFSHAVAFEDPVLGTSFERAVGLG